MAKLPDHMKGIAALPSTRAYNDALTVAKANSGPRTPDQRRALSDQLEALRMDAMRERNENFPSKGSPFGPQGTLAKFINKTAQKEVNKRVADSAPEHATLRSRVPSTCLESLTWRDGVAHYSFYRGGSIDYSTPMSKQDWLDWIAADSIGAYGNSSVFD